jgi:hypothetical protein
MQRFERRLFLTLPLIPLASRCLRAATLRVNYPVLVVSPGDSLMANVVTDADGSLGFESDFLQSSSTQPIDDSGITAINLGPVSAPGFYKVVVAAGGARYAATVSVVAEPGGRYRLIEGNMSSVTSAPQTVDQSVLDTFWAGFTKPRLKKAFTTVIEPWMAANAVGIGSTVVICMVPALLAECGWSVVNKSIDLAVVTVRAMINLEVSDGLLTSDDADSVRMYLGVVDGANKVADIILSTDLLERALKVAAVTTDLVIDSDTSDVQLAVSYGRDGYGKYAVILKVLREL